MVLTGDLEVSEPDGHEYFVVCYIVFGEFPDLEEEGLVGRGGQRLASS